MNISSQKSKGSQFEYSVRDSLAQKYSDVLLSKQEGFYAQHDIIIHSKRIKIECKKHKGFSWNELEKYFDKLAKRDPVDYTPLVIFQSNRQPCLVFSEGSCYISDDKTKYKCRCVVKFDVFFNVPFIKHKGR